MSIEVAQKDAVDRLGIAIKRIALLRKALEATQWGITDRCPVCAGWMMGPYGETDHKHTPDCIVAIALTETEQ